MLERETDRLDELLQRKNDEIRLLKARAIRAPTRAPALTLPRMHERALATNARTRCWTIPVGSTLVWQETIQAREFQFKEAQRLIQSLRANR